MRDPRIFVQRGLAALAMLAGASCAGTTYVQPERPPEAAPAAVLPVRALSLAFDRGTAVVDAGGAMTFDGAPVGTFSEDGAFTMPGDVVWARMDADGAITVTIDDPAQPGPSRATFTTHGGRLVRPDGSVLATLDASGQLVTAFGSFAVTGINTRATRLALFLYLVAATYAEDLPERAPDEEADAESPAAP